MNIQLDESKAVKLSTIQVPDRLRKRIPIDSEQLGDGINELFGNGLVPGSTILFSGVAGGGKSSLLLQILDSLGVTSLYNTGEEAMGQLKLTTERLEVTNDFYVSSKRKLENFLAEASSVKAKVAVQDSIQCLHTDTDLNGRDISDAGSKIQLVAVTEKIYKWAQDSLITVILVCHQTKNGDMAGPQTIAHIVDAVINMRLPKVKEELTHEDRVICAEKNRFGPSNLEYMSTMSSAGFMGFQKVFSDGAAVGKANGVKGIALDVIEILQLGDKATRKEFIKAMTERGVKPTTASTYWNTWGPKE